MNRLDNNDLKKLKTFYVMLNLSLALLPAIFITTFTFILIVMINDVFLNSQSVSFLPVQIFIGTVIVYTVGFLILSLYPMLSLKGKFGKSIAQKLSHPVELQEKPLETSVNMTMMSAGRLMQYSDNESVKDAGKAMEITAAIDTTADVLILLTNAIELIKELAQKGLLALPKMKKWCILTLFFPSLLSMVCAIPIFRTSIQETRQLSLQANTAIEQMTSILEQKCYVSSDNPLEHYRDSGYYVRGYLNGEPDSSYYSYVFITFDKKGIMTDISYNSYLDIHKEPKENLQIVADDFAQLYALIQSYDGELLSTDLLLSPTLLEEFCNTFLQSGYSEDFSIEVDGENKSRLYYSLDANLREDPQDERFPSIYVDFYAYKNN